MRDAYDVLAVGVSLRPDRGEQALDEIRLEPYLIHFHHEIPGRRRTPTCVRRLLDVVA